MSFLAWSMAPCVGMAGAFYWVDHCYKLKKFGGGFPLFFLFLFLFPQGKGKEVDIVIIAFSISLNRNVGREG